MLVWKVKKDGKTIKQTNQERINIEKEKKGKNWSIKELEWDGGTMGSGRVETKEEK